MARKGSTQLPEYTPHAATTPPENPDLLDQLSFEHRQLQRVWSELQLAHRRHVDERPGARFGLAGQQTLGVQIARILAEHDEREQHLLYPVVARVVGDDWAERAKADHADFRDLLGEVDGENPEDDGVFEIYTEVFTKVMAHIDEEENVVFPMLRTVVPAGELADPGLLLRSGPPPGDVIDLGAADRGDAAGNGDGSPADVEDRDAGRGRGRLRLRRRQRA